jgi:hypothetical protein
MLATTPEEAAAHARAIGYPVAVKVQSRQVLHKTDIGGVVLGLRDDDAVITAFQRVLANARAALPNATLDGVLIQEMAPVGVEVIFGMKRDERFGPILLFGVGGIYVETYHDVALRRGPLTPRIADSMIHSIRAKSLLEGSRGSAPVDLVCLRDALVGFSRAIEWLGPRASQVEVNPFIVGPWGGMAVDAVMMMEGSPSTGSNSAARRGAVKKG